jgi:hypothetical protein
MTQKRHPEWTMTDKSDVPDYILHKGTGYRFSDKKITKEHANYLDLDNIKTKLKKPSIITMLLSSGRVVLSIIVKRSLWRRLLGK